MNYWTEKHTKNIFNICLPFSAKSWNRERACSTTDRSLSEVTFRVYCPIQAFNSAMCAVGVPNTTSFKLPECQKSHGLRSGDRDSQVVRKSRHIILAIWKCCFSSCFTGFAIRGGTRTCIKMIGSTLPSCGSAGMTWLRKRSYYWRKL